VSASTINWQYFPRSQRLPDHLQQVVGAFKEVEASFQDHDARWRAWAASTDRAMSSRPSMESNDVLRIVEPQLRAIGYDVESPGAPLQLVVLWGPNGETRKAYEADAKREHTPGRETVIEVEAGGAHANNRWRKDLMEACIMPYVDYLVIAVRNHYWHTSGGRPINTRDFHIVTTELDALYESRRLELPLQGILVIGY
jgi:hypothetical protein